MNRKQQLIIIGSTSTAAVVIVVLLIIYWNHMKQSLKGAMTGNYFSDSELYASDTAKRLGLDNTPTKEAWTKLYALRDNVLNPARERLGSFIRVNCAYRSKAVNSAVGGASNSQHMTGEAADITAGSVAKNKVLFPILVALGNFDQLIWEKGGQWIHVSFRSLGNRGQMLSYNGSTYANINNNWKSVIA